MVRSDIVARKVARAAERLEQAETLLSRPRGDFVAHRESRDLACFYLFLTVQECIDLAAHWVADSGWQSPDDAASTFDSLADHGVFDPSLAAGMRAAVGLRNLIAHGYAALDFARLHEEASAGVRTIRRFLDETAKSAGL